MERIYGIRHGNNQHETDEDMNNVQILTQEDLAKLLERIYGIRHGGNRSSSTIGGLATQEDLLKQLERIYGIREGSHGEKRANNVQSNFTQQDLAAPSSNGTSKIKESDLAAG